MPFLGEHAVESCRQPAVDRIRAVLVALFENRHEIVGPTDERGSTTRINHRSLVGSEYDDA